jgi:hypothetical protein
MDLAAEAAAMDPAAEAVALDHILGRPPNLQKRAFIDF